MLRGMSEVRYSAVGLHIYMFVFAELVHHTRAFNTHGRPKQLSSMECLVDYSCSR